MAQELDFNPNLYEKDEFGRLRYKLSETRLKRLGIPFRYSRVNYKTNIDETLKQHLERFPELGMEPKSLYFVGDIDVSGFMLSKVTKYYGSFIGMHVIHTNLAEIGSSPNDIYTSCDVLCVANLGNDYFNDFNKTILNFGRIIKHRYNNMLPTYYSSDKSLNDLHDEKYMPTFDLKIIYASSRQIDVMEAK